MFIEHIFNIDFMYHLSEQKLKEFLHEICHVQDGNYLTNENTNNSNIQAEHNHVRQNVRKSLRIPPACL